MLDLLDESLEEAVEQIVVKRKRVSVSRVDDAHAVIARPCGNAEIASRLREHGGDDARARVLIQEVGLLLGTLIKADPELFKGTLTLRPRHLALHVEDLLNKILQPAYRQLSIEAMLAVSAVCRANSGLVIEGQLVIDVLLRTAVLLAAQQDQATAGGHDEAGAWLAFYASAPHRVANFVMAALEQLLEGEEEPVP